MRSQLYRDSVAAVLAWCRREKITMIDSLRHVHPRAYVVGYAAPKCLIVATPWADAEPQVREFQRANPLESVRRFDASLKAGDWCITAYISTEHSGETIAIPLVDTPMGRRKGQTHSPNTRGRKDGK